MASRKKSRKVGLIGVRKDPDYKPPVKADGKKQSKKHKGKPAGSRHNIEQNKASSSSTASVKTDKRLGSKKPIKLVVENDNSTKIAPKATPKVRFKTPKDELAAIEADQRLTDLLNKVDNGEALSIKQQDYVDKCLARHRELCDLLGIDVDLDDNEDNEDPWSKIDSISLDDYKD